VRVVVTVLLITVKFAVVEPGDTVTALGTVAIAVLLLERVTDIPFVGAGPLRVTVPLEGLPPLTVEGLRLKDERLGAETVNR
jgi:hypothetical protein